MNKYRKFGALMVVIGLLSIVLVVIAVAWGVNWKLGVAVIGVCLILLGGYIDYAARLLIGR